MGTWSMKQNGQQGKDVSVKWHLVEIYFTDLAGKY